MYLQAGLRCPRGEYGHVDGGVGDSAKEEECRQEASGQEARHGR